jgi:hypothetical protein
LAIGEAADTDQPIRVFADAALARAFGQPHLAAIMQALQEVLRAPLRPATPSSGADADLAGRGTLHSASTCCVHLSI